MNDRRLTHLVFSLTAFAATSSLAGAARAERVDVDVAATSTFAAGDIGDVGSPSLGARASVRFLITPQFSLGVVGNVQRQSISSADSESYNQGTTLSVSSYGLTSRFTFGVPEWPTRPFIGLDGGLANYSTGSDADFAPLPLKTKSSGFFLVPQIGLDTQLLPRVRLEVAFMYQYLHANDALEVGGAMLEDLSGAGFIAGFAIPL